MTSTEKYDLVRKLIKLSSKRDNKTMLLLLFAFPAFLLPGNFKWFGVVFGVGAQIAAGMFKFIAYEPLMLKDRILQEDLFTRAKKADKNYILVLRPTSPSAFAFSDEREAGTGSGLSGAPHPLSQPYEPYEHGYKVFERLEREIEEVFFVALGDLHHAYSRIGLYRTIFLKSSYEDWEQTVEALIKGAEKIIYVPDISNGMKRELSFIMEGGYLQRTVFLLPASTNPNARIKDQNAAWKRITEEFHRKEIYMPESYDPKANVYMAVIGNILTGVDISAFLAKETPGPKATLKQIINNLLESELISEEHFDGLYEHELCQRFINRS